MLLPLLTMDPPLPKSINGRSVVPGDTPLPHICINVNVKLPLAVITTSDFPLPRVCSRDILKEERVSEPVDSVNTSALGLNELVMESEVEEEVEGVTVTVYVETESVDEMFV